MNTKDIVPVIQKEVSPFMRQALSIEIVGEDTKAVAVELLSTLNKQNDRIVEEREKITKPLNQALKVERARWKPIESALDEAISAVRSKLSAYQTEAKRIADAEAAKIAARIKPGKGNLTPETGVQKIAEIDAPKKKTDTDVGSVDFRTVRKFEVVNFALIPDTYKLPNEPAIRRAMADNTPVDGVRYYEEEVPYNTR